MRSTALVIVLACLVAAALIPAEASRFRQRQRLHSRDPAPPAQEEHASASAEASQSSGNEDASRQSSASQPTGSQDVSSTDRAEAAHDETDVTQASPSAEKDSALPAAQAEDDSSADDDAPVAAERLEASGEEPRAQQGASDFEASSASSESAAGAAGSSELSASSVESSSLPLADASASASSLSDASSCSKAGEKATEESAPPQGRLRVKNAVAMEVSAELQENRSPVDAALGSNTVPNSMMDDRLKREEIPFDDDHVAADYNLKKPGDDFIERLLDGLKTLPRNPNLKVTVVRNRNDLIRAQGDSRNWKEKQSTMAEMRTKAEDEQAGKQRKVVEEQLQKRADRTELVWRYGLPMRGNAVKDNSFFKSSEEYTYTMWVKPISNVEEAANIVHKGTADYVPSSGFVQGQGGRGPSVWFHPQSTRLYVRLDTNMGANDGCDIDQELPKEVWAHVALVVTQSKLTVYLDGTSKCEKQFTKAILNDGPFYVSDPWHPPCNCNVADVRYFPDATNVDARIKEIMDKKMYNPILLPM